MNKLKTYCEKRAKTTVAIVNRLSNEPQPKKLKTDNVVTMLEMLNKNMSTCEMNEWTQMIAPDRESKAEVINETLWFMGICENETLALQKYREQYKFYYKTREQDFKKCKEFYKRFKQKYPEFQDRKHLDPEINLDRCRAGISSI